MIEQVLQELTVAVRALTDAVVGYPAPSTGVEAKPSKKETQKKPEEPTVTLEQVSEATRNFCMEHSIGAASDILQSFGVKSVKNLTEDQYGAYLAKLNSFEGDD